AHVAAAVDVPETDLPCGITQGQDPPIRAQCRAGNPERVVGAVSDCTQTFVRRQVPDADSASVKRRQTKAVVAGVQLFSTALRTAVRPPLQREQVGVVKALEIVPFPAARAARAGVENAPRLLQISPLPVLLRQVDPVEVQAVFGLVPGPLLIPAQLVRRRPRL